MMADEAEEVRLLLSRHRLAIVRELIQTNLIQILVKHSVISVEEEELISGESELEKRCDHLIEIISKDGFEKFKQFCYAIESECCQLISDLINDRLSQNAEEIRVTLSDLGDQPVTVVQ
ncbi:uncharacterized protein LOC128744779 isoform X2 [Sabethes cyaneus]|uniref:uncharacterized protein LOC128744779 isoform X2 n=1 Tax=Sabethes cyaneus TaxID=53552 RepID=UPI00237E67F4|nr:uncharacterized protein LOC128744779 isoform X2 [Sabethes cyaneus]